MRLSIRPLNWRNLEIERIAQSFNKIRLGGWLDQRRDDVAGVARHALFSEVEGNGQRADRRFVARNDGYRFRAAFFTPLDDEALDAVDPCRLCAWVGGVYRGGGCIAFVKLTVASIELLLSAAPVRRSRAFSRSRSVFSGPETTRIGVAAISSGIPWPNVTTTIAAPRNDCASALNRARTTK